MSMRYLHLGNLLLLSWLGCLPLLGQGSQPSLQLLQKNIEPFSPEALADTSELTQFRPLFRGKAIVAIGEVTHGTRQTAMIQTKLARDLCQSYKFTSIVLTEIYASATLSLNHYVVHNHGTLDDALAPLAEAQPIAAELVDLIQWVHQQNRHRPLNQRIWIVGTEIDPPNKLAQLLRMKARELLAPEADSILSTLSFLPTHLLNESYSPQDQSFLKATFNRCLDVILNDQIDSLTLLNRWEHHLLAQHQLAWRIYASGEEAPRDSAMFASIQWLRVQRPGTKIVIINGHNAHIEKQPCYKLGFSGVKRLGHYLHQNYGASYCALGTEIDGGLFLSGSDRGTDSVAIKMPRSRKGMGALLCTLLPTSYGLLDLRGTDMLRFFETHKPRLSYGTSEQGVGYLAASRQIPLAFDGFVFLGPSRPADFVKIAPPHRFGVHLALSTDLLDSLLAKKQLMIDCEQISWLGQANRAHDLRLQVYQHDQGKRVQSFVAKELTGHSRNSLFIKLHPHTRYVSISVVGRNGRACTIGQIKLNGRPVVSSSLQLVTNAETPTGSYQSQNSGFWWQNE